MRTIIYVTFAICSLLCMTSAMGQQKPINYAKLPLAFEKNIGQTDKRVKFFARGTGYSLFLKPDEAVFSLRKRNEGAVLRMQLSGANPRARESAQGSLSGTINYFRGSDPQRWLSGVSRYARVGFSEVYSGVDVVYYGVHNHLEYDFVVKPEGHSSSIRLRFQGARRVRSLSDGSLWLDVGNGSVKWHAPVAYQERGGVRCSVSSRYVICGANEVGFSVGSYDHSLPLVIDPALAFSTYLGGTGDETIKAIAVDAKGAVYVGGYTNSLDFPVTSGAYQTQATYGGLFVTKLSPDGKSLIYSTYLGNDYGVLGGIAVDAAGRVYLAGTAWNTTGIPTTSGVFQPKFNTERLRRSDGFVTKLSADGASLIYSTFLGGNDNDVIGAIAVDGSGNAYLTGATSSNNFPTTTGAYLTQRKTYSGFVTKLSADAKSLAYSTYLGGNGDFWSWSIAVDGKGCAYVAGSTKATDYPVTHGALQENQAGGYDGFVTKFKADGSGLLYSTYLGGGVDDYIQAIAVDKNGAVYVVGNTGSKDFHTTPGAVQTQYSGGYYDGFVTKISANGKSLVYSTYLGGTNNLDVCGGVTIDAYGNAYIAGTTNSYDFPLSSGAFQPGNKGGSPRFGIDGFISKLSADGDQLFYSTFIGGTADDGCGAIAIDSKGAAYVLGETFSSDFPVSPKAFQKTKNGTSSTKDAFIAKFNLPRSIVLLPTAPLWGGDTVTGAVLMDRVVSSDTTITLGADNKCVQVPSSVVVPKGSNYVKFNVVTTSPDKDTLVRIAPNPADPIGYATLIVYATRKLTLNLPVGLIYGTNGKGSVVSDIPAPVGGMTLTLASDNPALTVPNAVVIPANQTTATFTLIAGNVTTDTIANITANFRDVALNGRVVVQAEQISRVTFGSGSAKGGDKMKVIVGVKGTIPAEGLVVSLSSDKAEAPVPATIAIPAGKNEVEFYIQTATVTQTVTVTITATYGVSNVSAKFTIKP